MIRLIMDKYSLSNWGVNMTCSQCAGHMIEDVFLHIDIDLSEGNRILFVWRCLNCRNFIERLANSNQDAAAVERQVWVVE